MLRKNEKELFDIISENDNPEQAAIIEKVLNSQ